MSEGELLESFKTQLKTLEGAEENKDQLKALRAFETFQAHFFQKSFFAHLSSFFLKNKKKKVFYLYGPVGRGKTYLLDFCFKQAPFSKNQKLKMSFTSFLRMLHSELHFLRSKFDNKKKTDFLLRKIAKNLAKKTSLLFLDEVFVSDVVDAMLIANFFRILKKENIFFLMSSNFAPNKLYEGGVRRASFLPFIEFLEKESISFNLNGFQDYRMKPVFHFEKCFFDEKTACKLFPKITKTIFPDQRMESFEFMLQKRKFILLRQKNRAFIWFKARELLEGVWAREEFEWMAEHYPIIFLQDIPQLKDKGRDVARRFMEFIDVIYERRVKLIFSSSYPIMSLEAPYPLEFEFERTKSRLNEMQNLTYAKKQIEQFDQNYGTEFNALFTL